VIRQVPALGRVYVWTFFTGLASLILFSVLLTHAIQLTLLVLLSVCIVGLLMYGMLWLILRAIKRSQSNWAMYVRVPSQTALQMTALALGISLISVLMVLRTDLLSRWQQQLPQIRQTSLFMVCHPWTSRVLNNNCNAMAGAIRHCIPMCVVA
jgi:putative ABC transport system permease protein